jgi:chromatin licensing and DNA replication factor 1
MDAATPSKRAKTAAAAGSTPHKLRKAALFADQVTTPEKPMQKAAAPAADLVFTPEKSEQRPLLRRASGKGAVALSVKEVRRAALGLRRPDKGPSVVAEEDALESVARELGVGSGAGRSPVKRRPEVKLPER